MTTTSHAAFPLLEVVRVAIRYTDAGDRRLREDAFWCHVTGTTPVRRIQGWKLHLSATPLSAPMVLHAAACVLLRNGCQFKFAKDLDRVTELTSIRYDRAQAGKFITAYPHDDEEFHRLAAELCEATAGMPGPRILSDRQYRPGSIVQYRFGAFSGVSVLTNDGSFEARVQDPSGKPVTDQRKPWFTPPSWVNPVTPPGAAAATGTPAASDKQATPARPVLAGGRFEVARAIQQSARGGVYQATDSKTGRLVLLKEARAHIGSDLRGQDSCSLLAHEATVLSELSPLTPAMVCLFHKDDHMFLAEEFVEGQTMSRYIRDLTRARRQQVMPAAELALALAKLVNAVHHREWVLRDLTSNNVMVTPEGKLILIDPEYAARRGDVVSRVYTPGFVAPEILDSPLFGFAPDAAVDRFAVGAMLIHLLIGAPPAFMADETEPGHRISDRIHRLLALAAQDRPLIEQWWPLLTGLCDSDPDKRWTLDQAVEFLQAVPAAATSGAVWVSAEISSQAGDRLAGRIIEDGLGSLLATMRPAKDRLWEADGFGTTTDPLNVQYGAAGILAVLTRATTYGHSDAADALPVVADWMRKRIEQVPRVLPGLHFGRGGTAWALREAAEVLGDASLAMDTEEFGLRMPIRWPNPDICHGAAGAGLTQLRLWQLSGRSEFLDRARDCADGLLSAACFTEDGVFWPVPEDFASALAGGWHLGFAHGVAGVGAFLLAAAQACGDPRYLEMACAAGRTLANAADLDEATGAVTWPIDREGRAARDGMVIHWCRGASGIGSFLLRLAAVQPDENRARPYWQLVRGAALAVHAARWISSTAACHGLAGNGQFLLDAQTMAEQDENLDATEYRRFAEDLAQVIVTRHALRDGRMVIPDESGLRITAGYGTGLAGVLDFLLRLSHGGRRLWMVELS